MRKIWVQIFILIIGIILCVIGHNGVKKYFYRNYYKDIRYVVAYNNFSNVSFSANIIEENNKILENITTTTMPIITTTTTTKTTTKNFTTPVITTTTQKPTEVFESIITEPIINNEDIIYDGLTLNELTEKLNKNLKSNLTNTGYYFANYYLKTGLDPYLAVAIVLQETGCKWTCSKLVRNCNNIGGMKGSPKCNGGSYIKYDTLEEGINGYLDMLYNNYYSKGLITPELINPKYAASTTWSTNVNSYINTIKSS